MTSYSHLGKNTTKCCRTVRFRPFYITLIGDTCLATNGVYIYYYWTFGMAQGFHMALENKKMSEQSLVS